MRRVRITYPFVATLAVAMGVALALVLPAGAQADVQVKSPPNKMVALEATATLEANGAAVFTALAIICPTPTSNNYSYARLSVIVTEVVNGAIVTGRADREITNCTWKPQAVRVAVTPVGTPFTRGAAFGQAQLSYYWNNMSRSGWDERTIQIV